jgi:predicted nucleic acid-binding protein
MTCVMDASVAIAAARKSESAHVEAHAFLSKLLSSDAELWLPTLFQIEVVASLCRQGATLAIAETFVGTVLMMPARVVTNGAARCERGSIRRRVLRSAGADAVYTWLAQKKGAALVSLDGEHLTRVPFACRPGAAF